VFFRIIPLPAYVMLGYWMAIQVVSSLVAPSSGGGVAYTAHIGGFLAGVLLILVFRNPKLVGAKRHGVRLSPEELDQHGWW